MGRDTIDGRGYISTIERFGSSPREGEEFREESGI